MLASKLFDNLRRDYIKKQRDRTNRCSQLYSAYSIKYHEFVLVRDLHVHLAGCSYSVHAASDFAVDELQSYQRAMSAGADYLRFCIDSYDADMVVPCRHVDLMGMTRERIRDEFLNPIHPDLSNFVVSTVHTKIGCPDNIEVKLFPDLFTKYVDIRKYSLKMKSLFFRYYPRYSPRPTAFNRIYISNTRKIGVLYGMLIFSEAEHAGHLKYKLNENTTLSPELVLLILGFMFPRMSKTISNSGSMFVL